MLFIFLFLTTFDRDRESFTMYTIYFSTLKKFINKKSKVVFAKTERVERYLKDCRIKIVKLLRVGLYFLEKIQKEPEKVFEVKSINLKKITLIFYS